jgi:hypothetical protein
MDSLENDHEYHLAVKNNKEREKLLVLYCNPHSFTTGMDKPIKHRWQAHTSAQFKYPTPENRVTKVYCIYCLEVKDI